MTHLSLDYSNIVDKFVDEEELKNIQAQVTLADTQFKRRHWSWK